MDPLTPEVEPTTIETPAATAVVEAPSVGLHDMTRAERDAYLREGKMPTRETKPVLDGGDAADADSSAAPAKGEKAAEIAAKDTKAASEPAAPAKDKKARNSEANRVQELLEDRKRSDRRVQELEARLAGIERSKADGKKDSSTTDQPSEPTWKKTAADKAFPKINDFESPDEWAAAVTEYTRAQIESGLSAKDQQSAEANEVRQVAERAFAKGAAEVEADPTVLDRIHPNLESMPGARAVRAQGGEPNADHVMKDMILLEMDKPLGLMAFYSTPEGWQEWVQMRGMDERGMLRTIIAREHHLGTTVAPGEAAVAGEKKPAAKTFTKTPNPPEKEGPKGERVVDGAKAAVETGDFAAFEKTMDERGDGLGRRFGRRRAS